MLLLHWSLSKTKVLSTFLRCIHVFQPQASTFKNFKMSSTNSSTSMSSSPDKVVECVPNFSEGRKADVIEAIASAIRGIDGCTLLDVDPGESTNRTVYTFVGNPLAVVAGALQAAKVAYKLIDMSKHHGEHPRIGALDVCPFVPVSNVTMEECVECSHQFGRRLATELEVPVYLYEEAQQKDYRKSLAQIRHGQYEKLPTRLKDAEWAPDFGPAEFVPSWGASVTGARKFLIAYNVNLLATKQQAHRIALNIREAGRGPSEPGRLKAVKALGWYLEEQDLAQVSMNLTDYEVTPLHVAFEECSKDAKEFKLAVVGSEVVGMIPLQPLLMAADYFIEKEGLFVLQEQQKIRLAIERLGLSSISEFKPQEKIIEYCIRSNADGPLLNSTVRSFVEQLGARTSAPGGGSASACIASMGSALGTMVGLLTYGNKKYESLDSVMRATIGPLYEATQKMLPLIDKDTQAFNDYMTALKLPHTSEEEKAKRVQAMDNGLKKAIEVPLSLMRLAHGCWPHMMTLAQHGNVTTLSDLKVGAQSLNTGIKGAYYNVCINLKQIKDDSYVTEISEQAEGIMKESEENCSKVMDMLATRDK